MFVTVRKPAGRYFGSLILLPAERIATIFFYNLENIKFLIRFLAPNFLSLVIKILKVPFYMYRVIKKTGILADHGHNIL